MKLLPHSFLLNKKRSNYIFIIIYTTIIKIKLISRKFPAGKENDEITQCS
jgi:hypothetical protein